MKLLFEEGLPVSLLSKEVGISKDGIHRVVIVAATLSNNPADYEALVDLVEQIQENRGNKPSEVLGDSRFSSYENLQYLEGKNIEGYFQTRKLKVFIR